jgi:hypothetical protein
VGVLCRDVAACKCGGDVASNNLANLSKHQVGPWVKYGQPSAVRMVKAMMWQCSAVVCSMHVAQQQTTWSTSASTRCVIYISWVRVRAWRCV